MEVAFHRLAERPMTIEEACAFVYKWGYEHAAIELEVAFPPTLSIEWVGLCGNGLPAFRTTQGPWYDWKPDRGWVEWRDPYVFV